MVEWLFLAVPWACLRFSIVVFPDHTHLLFYLLAPFYSVTLNILDLRNVSSVSK